MLSRVVLFIEVKNGCTTNDAKICFAFSDRKTPELNRISFALAGPESVGTESSSPQALRTLEYHAQNGRLPANRAVWSARPTAA